MVLISKIHDFYHPKLFCLFSVNQLLTISHHKKNSMDKPQDQLTAEEHFKAKYHYARYLKRTEI